MAGTFRFIEILSLLMESEAGPFIRLIAVSSSDGPPDQTDRDPRKDNASRTRRVRVFIETNTFRQLFGCHGFGL